MTSDEIINLIKIKKGSYYCPRLNKIRYTLSCHVDII